MTAEWLGCHSTFGGSRFLLHVSMLLFVSVTHCIYHSYLISSPFSCKDFNLGSGGTLATQGLKRCPPTVSWQDAQSPFRHEYFGLTPREATADFNALPALKFFFLPLYAKTVICNEDPLTRLTDLDVLFCWKASVLPNVATATATRNRKENVFIGNEYSDGLWERK